MTHSRPVREIAQFPACPHCGLPAISRVSDSAICIQVGDNPPETIPRSEAAAYLRFVYKYAPLGVVAQHLYLALGECIAISRVIDTLRKRLGSENIPCEKRRKSDHPGYFGVYYLPEHIRIWEPDQHGGGDET